MAERKPTGSRKNLPDLVFDGLLQSIKSGSYGVDERLPTEHALAAEFQVSRPVVREALRRLRDQGLVYSRRGAGTFVRQIGLRQPLGFGSVESISDLFYCYEFRLTLEPEAAAAAAERRTDDMLADIAAALDLMRDATARKRHREDADFAFHGAIARASQNRYFWTALDALKEHIDVAMQFHGQSLKQSPSGLEHVLDEHTRIFDAVRDGDAGAARKLMRDHLTGSRDRLFDGRPPGPRR